MKKKNTLPTAAASAAATSTAMSPLGASAKASSGSVGALYLSRGRQSTQSATAAPMATRATR